MKKSKKSASVLSFMGIIAAAVAAVAFILVMATPVMTITIGNNLRQYAGPLAIFGGTYDPKGVAAELVGAPVALVAWILLIVAFLVLVAAFVLPLANVKAVRRFAGLLNACAAIALIAAGVMLLLTKDAFIAANQDYFDGAKFATGIVDVISGNADKTEYVVGGGWVVGSILCFVGGAVALVPMGAGLLAKK